MQMGQMEPFSDKVNPSVLNMQMGVMEPMSSNTAAHQFAVSNQQKGLVESMPYIPGSQNLTGSNKQMGHMEPKVSNMGSQQLMHNRKDGEAEDMLNNLGSPKLLPSKRKAAVEPLFSNSLQQHSSIPNTRVAQMAPLLISPGSPQLSAPNKRTVQMMQSLSNTPELQNLTAPNKRMVRNESISSKSGSQQVPDLKNRTAQEESSPKGRTDSFEAVRSKMRESLAAALALVCQHEDKDPNEEKGSTHEAAITPQERQEDSLPAASTSASVDAAGLPEKHRDAMPSLEPCFAEKPNDSQTASCETFSKESIGNSVQTWKSIGQESQGNAVFPDGDVSFIDNFFVQDELLQGNGLSWAWDIDMEVAEAKEVQNAEKPKLVHVNVGGDVREQVVRSPQELAFQIEAELFKLFGGVNKKYKEKGRSLLFNLKDRNNPELRERVMSGEISPERLCSMTAEQLASKELSQWRMAKAEELAQMIVLPDSDVDKRRLVKKTHKGEYQVEIEQDDGVSVEVSVGTTMFTQIRPKDQKTGAPLSSEADEIKYRENVEGGNSSSENQDASCSLAIPADGTDLMQGLIVDELKDAEYLPPIVSLDEFMESLNSEPPFENLPVDGGQTKPLSDKEKSETAAELVTSDPGSKDRIDTNPGKADKIDVKITELDMKVKSSERSVERKTSPLGSTSTAEHVWEGVLQLNISAPVTVVGLLRSDEKTSTEEWPRSLEIKGRVRLDAFEKFLQELPMSRSRAVMVVQFCLKGGFSENERSSLSEVADSYVLEERLGYAEPAPGVEIYLCPPHQRILEKLSKNLSKDPTQILNNTDNCLIGVVVWRKSHLSSAISPNSSTHHKHSSKNQNFTSRKQQEKDTNVKSKAPVPFDQPPMNSGPPLEDDDDDDIPPGFGPGSTRDEDDLPEFNFSGNLNSPTPKSSSRDLAQGSRMTPVPQLPKSSPVSKMRELIHKYGQIGTSPTDRNWQEKRGGGLGNKLWNDDDDDIPEWQPQAPQQQLQPHTSMLGFEQPMQPHRVNQHLGSAAPQPPMQSPINVMENVSPSWQQGAARWAQPSGPHGQRPSSLGSQTNAGPYYGVPVLRAGQPRTNWRRDAPRSRGF